ncbi:MAG TPA: MFS transporter, partial [Chloroflexota bacterium]|nr:MFS transporter [Chloroflexota bacterium]
MRSALLYASGAFGFNLLFQSISLWLVFFYAPPPDSARSTIVPLAVLGLIMGIGRVLDAFDDPAIGHWSDSTRSRWGRRLPFIVAGAPFAALLFAAIWNPPALVMPWIAVYAFVVLQLYSVLSTIVHQPYEAALAELSRDSRGRLRLSGWKVFFGVCGAAVGLVGSGRVIERFGFGGMGVLFAAMAGGSILLSALGLRALPAGGEAPVRLPLREALRLTATNPQFLVFVCSEVAFSLALALLTALIP